MEAGVSTEPSFENVTANMTSSNQTGSESHFYGLIVPKIAVQAVIMALAIFGNACLLIALIRRKSKLTRMHIFILHLSIADIMVAIFNILPQMVWMIITGWHAGDFLCRFVKFMQIFVMYLSTYILVLTALDRRRAICDPLSSHTWTFRLVHLSVGVVYLLAAALSTPQAIIFKYQPIAPGSATKDCWVHFDPEWTLKFYITAFTILVYIIPLVILLYSYGSIYYTIFRRHKISKFIGNNNVRNPRGQFTTGASHKGIRLKSLDLKADQVTSSMVPRSSSFAGLSRAKIRTVQLTFVIIVAYVACWSPFFISQLWWLYDPQASNNDAVGIMILLASLNSCCNPWIYLAFSGSISPTCGRANGTNRKRLNGGICTPESSKSTAGYTIHRSTTRSTMTPLMNTPVNCPTSTTTT